MNLTATAPPGRQALKTRRTRARLIEATLALIRERGFAAATAQGIARRAGVTWGAAQHQFGCKEDILEAILARAYARFIDTMGAPALRRGSRAARARLFVARMWAHYQGDDYRVSLEILRATRGERRRRARAWEQLQGRAHLKVVREVFHESQLSDARLREALTFTHCCLTGLAIERIFESKVQHTERHLRRIAHALDDMLAAR
jgi:AcrR family transcriptional regulator